MKIRDRFVEFLLLFADNNGKYTPDGYERQSTYRPSLGEPLLMRALAKALRSTPENEHDSWLYYLPKRVAAAFEAFRHERKYQVLRDAYTEQTGGEIPSLINTHEGTMHRLLVLHSVIRLLPIIAAQATREGEKMPWLEAALDSYLHAQDNAIQQAWHGFVSRHYAPLMARIKAERHRGNKGVFGETSLETWACAGRVAFQFERGDESITAVADDGDPVGYRSGLNCSTIPYERAVAMIRDVTANFVNDNLREVAS